MPVLKVVYALQRVSFTYPRVVQLLTFAITDGANHVWFLGGWADCWGLEP